MTGLFYIAFVRLLSFVENTTYTKVILTGRFLLGSS